MTEKTEEIKNKIISEKSTSNRYKSSPGQIKSLH